MVAGGLGALLCCFSLNTVLLFSLNTVLLFSPPTKTRMIAGGLGRIAFYPSLFYTLLSQKFTSRTRFSRIDHAVLVGGLPFRSMKQNLIVNERVKGVIALNEAFELERFVPTEEEWNSAGVQYLALPTPDFIASPSQEFIKKGVSFILDHRERGDSVYVHCKAGRTRSATVAVCYMMTAYNLTPTEAVEAVKEKRNHIWLRETQLKSIRCYYEENVRIKEPSPSNTNQDEENRKIVA